MLTAEMNSSNLKLRSIANALWGTAELSFTLWFKLSYSSPGLYKGRSIVANIGFKSMLAIIASVPPVCVPALGDGQGSPVAKHTIRKPKMSTAECIAAVADF